jgi:rare lipoprotein A
MLPRVPSGRAANRLALLALLALAGCAGVPLPSEAPPAAQAPPSGAGGVRPGLALPPAGSGRGAYYKDDGPGENVPPDLDQVPDAQVRIEPLLPRSNRPYVVFGKTYRPVTDNKPFTQRGIGSWYGKKFHGQRTASGELYDMYKMTAAHPTLPIPSFARVTNIGSGRQVIVRINDRGPFHANRVIDVSYTAALKLGLLEKGSRELQVERLLPSDIERIRAEGPDAPAAASAGPAGLSGSGFFVQLGAFSKAVNAEAARLRAEPHAVNLGALEVVQTGSLFRLVGGPFDSRAAAVLAARELPDGLGLKPVVIQR